MAKQDPKQTSKAHQNMADDWALLRTVMGGTKQMRGEGTAYLPQHEGETAEAYDVRLATAVLTNYFEDAVRVAASTSVGAVMVAAWPRAPS